jgi:hypothetical protein
MTQERLDVFPIDTRPYGVVKDRSQRTIMLVHFDIVSFLDTAVKHGFDAHKVHRSSDGTQPAFRPNARAPGQA